MKKDIEWLKKEIGAEMMQLEPNRKERWSDVRYQTLRNVAQKIYQLDEPEVLSQELPVIPKYVADWIEAERGTMSNWKLPSGFISDSKYKKDQRRYKWSQVEGNMDKFMSALINGYEVEKEKLYVVELSNSNGRFGKYENVFLNKRDGIVFIDSSRLFVNDIKKYSQYALTEKEIKDYDERYWSFAVEVSE